MAADTHADLISMAEIATLAGESRSTVGNWKSRQSDFPMERGSNSRGPLYDRDEVLEWLRSTGRLATVHGINKFALRLLDALRGSLRTDHAVDLIMVALGVKVAAQRQSPKVWEELFRDPVDHERRLDRAVHDLLPFISELYDPRVRRADIGIHEVIALLDSFDTRGDAGPALLDALIDTLMKNFGKATAEYASPPNVRQLLMRLAEPRGIIYDPGAGFAQLLVDAASYSSQDARLVAQEINQRTWELGTLNLFIRGIAADYQCGDTFRADAFPELLADVVLAIPPFNTYIPLLDQMQNDPRWVFGEPGPGDGNAAWIQHCLHHLAPSGRAFLVLPQGAVFEGGRGGRIRQRIIKADLLDAVVSLPPGLFLHTSIPTALLIFERDRPNKGNTSTPGSILMVDASDLGQKRGRLEAFLPEDVIASLSDPYHSWRTRNRIPSDPHLAVASFNTVVENDFVIDPRRYVTGPQSMVDEAQLLARKETLQKSLADAIAASNVADAKLLKTLGRDQ
jgi:type I restriction enzyme M protein